MSDEQLTRTEFKRDLSSLDESLRGELNALDERLRADMDAREKRLRGDMDARDERLKRYYDIQTEKLRDDIRKLSDGYIAGFERLERIMAETRHDWSAKFQLHEDVLKNHSTRITALEARKRS